MSFERNLNYYGPLQFDADGFAINPTTGENVFNAKDFRDLLVSLVGTGTLTFFGTIQNNPPDFNAPSTILNSWANIMSADYTTPGLYYAGGAGVAVSGGTKIVELNTNLLTWIGIKRSVDTVDALITVTDNL